MKDLEGKPYEKWLTLLGLFGLEETEGSLIISSTSLQGEAEE